MKFCEESSYILVTITIRIREELPRCQLCWRSAEVCALWVLLALIYYTLLFLPLIVNKDFHNHVLYQRIRDFIYLCVIKIHVILSYLRIYVLTCLLTYRFFVDYDVGLNRPIWKSVTVQFICISNEKQHFQLHSGLDFVQSLRMRRTQWTFYSSACELIVPGKSASSRFTSFFPDTHAQWCSWTIHRQLGANACCRFSHRIIDVIRSFTLCNYLLSIEVRNTVHFAVSHYLTPNLGLTPNPNPIHKP